MEDQVMLVISSSPCTLFQRGEVYWPDVLGINLPHNRILDICAAVIQHLNNTDAICQILSGADESEDFLEELAENNLALHDCPTWECLPTLAEDKNTELGIKIFEVDVEKCCMRMEIHKKIGKGYEQLLHCINELKVSEEELSAGDEFPLKPELLNEHQIQDSEPESQFYHSSQESLADILIERIKFVLSHYYGHPKGEEFSTYTDFDFQIYTARSNMLETQTIQRLCHRQSGCFPAEMYAKPKELDKWAKERVCKYTSTKAEHLEDLKKKIAENKKTFYLIVADEAHWGITNSGISSTRGANNRFTNVWDDQNYPNVMVLLVSATPFNLLTTNSRIPETFVAVHNQSQQIVPVEEKIRQRLFDNLGVDVTDCVGPKKELHVVQWTEIYDKQLAEGLLFTLKIPLEKKFLWLYIDETHANEIAHGINLYKWKGSDTSRSQFLFQKTPKGIQIFSPCKKYVLVSNRQGAGNVGFVLSELCSDIYCSTFETLFNFGEDVLEIRSSSGHYLKFDRKTACVASGRAPADTRTEYGFPCHSLEYSFIIESKQKSIDIYSGRQYISLNFYFNSMRNPERRNQLIREDRLFQTTQKECKIDCDSLLAIDYAYYILLIDITNMDQAYLSAQTLSEFFEGPDSPENFCTGYFFAKEEKMSKFIKELKDEGNSSGNILKPISSEKFQMVCDYLDDVCCSDLQRHVVKVSKLKNLEPQDSEDLAKLLIKYIFHAKYESFKKNICEIFDLLVPDGQTEKLNIISRNLKTPFSKLFSDGKFDILSESETFLIVHNMLQPSNSDSGIRGKMKVVRASEKTDGNLIYATVVAARKVAENIGHFEIIRYFDRFKLDNETNAQPIHRIWQILQRKDCDFQDRKTHRRCHCTEYRPPDSGQISCTNCHHKHTIISQFSDLDRLPCILILVDKGRLGDTFPPSFNTMDLRVRHNTRAPPLASVMQEFGRLCRYDVKSDLGNLPYALVGQKVMKCLNASLHKSAVFTSSFTKIDMHTKTKTKIPQNLDSLPASDDTSMRPQTEASASNYDHMNESKFKNRLLLQAEPQIGKTGVFLKTISALRRLICRKDEVRESEEPEIDSEGSGSDSDDESVEIIYQRDEDWKYPYWKDMKSGKRLKDKIESSKYSSIYGPYVHNEIPQYMPLSVQKKKSLKPISDLCRTDNGNKDKFRAFSYLEHNRFGSCVKCRISDEATVKQISVGGQMVKISVPVIRRFMPLLEKLQHPSETEFPNNSSFSADKEGDHCILKTWIFHPSYGRSEDASINYAHTMVMQDNLHLNCQYIQVLVVRREEFKAYSLLWQTTHALLELPSTFVDCDVDVVMGGIGFARLFIQRFAEELELPRIFVLDDNIYKMHKLIIDNPQPAEQCKSRVLTEIPIFEALKHLESLFICASAPKSEFVPYTDSCDCECEVLTGKNLHQFTGPSETYGVLGVLRFRPYFKNVKYGFKKTHVCSLVLLNIERLKKKEIHYQPWQVHEDLNLNNDCDDKNLIVCKYNQFLMSKKQTKTWIPKMYEWPDDVTLTLNLERDKADGTAECILQWIRAFASPKCLNLVMPDGNGSFEMVPPMHFPDKLADQLCMRSIFTGLSKVKLGKCHVVGFVNGENPLARDNGLLSIRNYFTVTPGIGGFNRHLVILPVEICMNLNLTTLKRFEMDFGHFFHPGTKIKVFTSHSILHFRNTVLAVLVHGKINCAADEEESKNCGIHFENQSKVSINLTGNEFSSCVPPDLSSLDIMALKKETLAICNACSMIGLAERMDEERICTNCRNLATLKQDFKDLQQIVLMLQKPSES